MAGSSLLALLDDIATLLDDVAVMTKVAAKKTAGVLGDDLALNAEQVSGVAANRELPVVWAVAKGSMVNKLILVPAALAISALIPWAVIPLLMLGGLFLCFEGVEKLAHKFLHAKEADDQEHRRMLQAVARSEADLLAFEKDKIKGAIRTDFVLSAEIIVITLGTVAAASFGKQVAVLSTIAIAMTVGVYGLVAGIVKLDDFGVYLSSLKGATHAGSRKIGAWILIAAPYLMKSLSVLGTAAMFMVGGAIIVHGVPMLHHFVEHHGEYVTARSAGWLGMIIVILLEAVIGILAGIATLLLITGGKRLFGKKPAHG
jgi:predicted DNA repair protein MutK